ncbi:NAD-dependent epimerase/dehydratase family protein [Thermomonospora umbrina]|uniref:Nucleoside-diphosphate-sugar epimerase n=1 Tax=Thermomonospora umbrina TaxID=111806 RepID=A0A3D9SPV6_9ACTN|nr:NAD-dependent epimerase/dehydratase family protein [Thermomonospora umbrina]REE97647.1 nucleoside-diphosphate-sugar epimerase [Thermomonospora umbrina]
MALHVILGAGTTGTATARLLADSGDRVRLVSRRGSGPDHPAIERVAADAGDTDRLTELARGADTLVNCAMPPYDRWPELWPPLAASVLTAAERTGAGYVMLGNLYGYGPVDGPFTEDLPMRPTTAKGGVRAKMWEDALAAHEAGRARVTEVRASDFVGAGAGSLFNFLVTASVLAGEPAVYPGSVAVPHAWSYTGDVARALAAAALDDRSWGRAWHVPSASEASVREVAVRLAEVTDSPAPRVEAMTDDEFSAFAAENPFLAEVAEMLYLYDRPCRVDSTDAERILGLKPTSLDDALTEMAGAPLSV